MEIAQTADILHSNVIQTSTPAIRISISAAEVCIPAEEFLYACFHMPLLQKNFPDNDQGRTQSFR